MDLRNQKLAIIEIQQNLLELFQSGMTLPYITPDGVYGTTTRSAVSDFQRICHLHATGVVDYTTWNELFEQATKSVESRKTADGIFPFCSVRRGSSVHLGDTSDLIRIVQIMLSSLSLYDLEDTVQSEVFDEATEKVIKHFQGIHRMPETGTLDLPTWNALACAYNRSMTTSDAN